MQINDELPTSLLMTGKTPDAQQLQNTWLHQLEKAQLASLDAISAARQPTNRQDTTQQPKQFTDHHKTSERGQRDTTPADGNALVSASSSLPIGDTKVRESLMNPGTTSFATSAFGSPTANRLHSSAVSTAVDPTHAGEPVANNPPQRWLESGQLGIRLSLAQATMEAHQPAPMVFQPTEKATQPAATGEPWTKRHMHLFQADDGIQVWIRDSEINTQTLNTLIDAISEQLGQLGLQLSELTLNGQKIRLDSKPGKPVAQSRHQPDIARNTTYSDRPSLDEIQHLVEHTIQSLG
ncbi:hypothetical protein [Chitinivorax sp. B]|uniref:hypothetical protein n=1 Tax=Chitinivorax sp. B TaxID=2502235 RepID=UPI0010F962F9|nr:hypothetical protein [Chitinivorax sp. B]